MAAPAGAQDRASLADSLAASMEHARSALARGRPEAAVEELRRAQAFLGLEIVYGQVEDPEPAVAAIARGLAEAYLALGDPYAAAIEAERGVAAEPADARLWALLGLARHRLVDLSGARLALGRAIGLDGNEADAWWGMGLVAIAQNRPREGVERVERALSLKRDPRYMLALARWAAAGGDYARAASALDRYLELGREDPRAEGYRNLRRFYDHLAQGPVAAIDRRITRAQLNFDLKPGDEIPYVPVQFDRRAPVYVLFDTGAERNVIDRAYAESIGLTPILPGGRLHGVYRQSPGGYAIVDTLVVGSVLVTRVPFAVGDFGSLALRAQGEYYIAGVINPSLLFRDFLVILDYRRRRIELLRYGAGAEEWLSRPSSFRRTTVPFAFDVNGIWPVVRARLDGSRELPLLVDTGASDLLIGRATGGALQLDLDRFSVAVGDQRRDGLSGILLDGIPSEPWGIAVHGILGFPFFRGSRVAFDYRNMVMIVEN